METEGDNTLNNKDCDTRSLLLGVPTQPPKRSRPRLHLHMNPGTSGVPFQPSPITPCSIFSFDLPNSPAILSAKTRYSRSARESTETPLSARSIFNFDFGWDERKSSSQSRIPSSPSSIKIPQSGNVHFQQLPTIQEARASFSTSTGEEGAVSSNESDSVCLGQTTTDWTSIRLIMVVILFTRVQFTVYFASLWPFLEEVDSSATSHDFALISAGYSIGMAAAAPLFGYWSNKLGCIRIPSICSMFLMLSVNSIYIILPSIQSNAKYLMGLARFFAGIAAGGNALLPTYWTYAAAPADRSLAAAMFDGAFSLGIAIGPILQIVFSTLGYPGFSIGSFISVNMYTSPAIIANSLIMVTLFLMIFKFKEVPMFANEDVMKRDSIVSTASTLLPSYDKLAVFICILCKMVQMFVYASIETMGSIFTQKMFDLSRTETSMFNSSLVAGSGFLGFLFLLAYVCTKTAKRVDNRIGVLIGVSICAMFIVVTYPYSFYSDKITSENCLASWCSDTSRIPKSLYASAYIIVFGIGFAMINVHLAAMFSSILGARRQGTWHGINTLMASSSRVVGPILVTDTLTSKGPQLVWIGQFLIWTSLIGFLLFFYKRLKPTH